VFERHDTITKKRQILYIKTIGIRLICLFNNFNHIHICIDSTKALVKYLLRDPQIGELRYVWFDVTLDNQYQTLQK